MPNSDVGTTVLLVTVLVISGTGSRVGKTVVSAAVAALAARRGERAAVLKPAQTGVAVSEPGDLAAVRALAGPVTTSELRRYPDRLPPETAARRSGVPVVSPSEVASAAAELHEEHELVLVEGTGGLLTRFDGAGSTLADAAWALNALLVVVAGAGSDALHTTALSAEVATARGLDVAGVVLGQWPREPDVAARCGVPDLPVAAAAPLLGVLRAGLGRASSEEFLAEADAGLSPLLGGSFDGESFSAKVTALL